MAEIWKPISGYEDLYEVSSEGRVRSFDRLIERTHAGQTNYILKGRVMKTRPDKDGYMLVTLNSDGIARTFKVHRLVAEAFISNPKGLPQVDHDDGRRSNNRMTNLKWSTVRDNLLSRKAIRISSSGHKGVRVRGEKFVAYANDPKTFAYTHLGTFDDINAAIAARSNYMEAQIGSTC